MEYFLAIGEAVKVPVFIQDAGAAGVAPALMARIAGESENVCYAKVETPPDAAEDSRDRGRGRRRP